MAELFVDTSAWIELVLGPATPPRTAAGRTMACSTLLAAELMSLAKRRPAQFANLRVLLEGVRLEPPTLDDMLDGGALHGRMRQAGDRKVSLIDCIVYASAQRLGVPLLTADRDLAGQPGVLAL